MSLRLVIANPNYSSWSLRPWLILQHHSVPFEVIRIPFLPSETVGERIARYSPARKVPVLLDGDLVIWESLAIAEYLAERFPDLQLWPTEPAVRAHARAVSAEMHAGFAKLREHMTLNCRRQLPGRGRGLGVAEEIARVCDIWRDCRARHGGAGEFLFGGFTIADAMFAPVVLRFKTYEVALDSVCRRYADAVLALPAMHTWLAMARAEPEVVARYEYPEAAV